MPPPQNAGPEHQKACYGLAKARCARLGSSCPSFPLFEGQHATCLSRTTDICLYAYAPKAGNVPATTVEKCAKTMETAACTDRLDGDFAACEHVAGQIADGKGCVYDAECATSFCARERNHPCGTCSSAPQEGAECKQGRCGSPGLTCIDNKCVKHAAKGEDCKGPSHCEAALTCHAGKCVEPLAADAKCDSGSAAVPCDPANGLFCDATSKTCKPVGLLNVGDACGSAVVGKRCRGETVCKNDRCVPTVRRDQPCSDQSGPCDAPSMCINGHCKVPDVALCAK
jgi:hypothetical protein